MSKLQNIRQRLKKLKKAGCMIAFSFLVALGVTILLEIIYPPTIISPIQVTPLVVSPEQKQFNVSTYLLPSYFSSASKIYACQYSPYATAFQFFKTELSLDNSSWVEIPLLNRSSRPDDYEQFADLGFVAIDKPTLVTIYGRYFIPEQNLTLPSDVSKEKVLESVKGQITFIRQITPRDRVLEILVFLTLFLASLQIVRFIREEWNKEELSENEGQSPKGLPTQREKRRN